MDKPSLSQHRNIWNINQRKGAFWRLGYQKTYFLEDAKTKQNPET